MARIDGTAGADKLNGTDASDEIYAGAGGDVVDGRGGADWILGGDGHDILGGGDGADTLFGEAGDDDLYGGAGDDDLDGGAGADHLYGDVGLDLASYVSAGAGVVANLAKPADNAGDAKGDLYYSIEGLIGGGFGDRLTGDAGANWLEGRAGADILVGGDGADTLDGGDGDDLLIGGAGRDLLVGGLGDDELVGDGAMSLDANALAVQRLYFATLDRAPDDAGWRAWVDRLEHGAKLGEVAAGFVGSQEFQSVYGALPNDKFVSLIYQNVLGRAADASGYAAWTGYLAAGGSRSDLVLQFAQSAEFQTASNPAAYTGQVFRLYDTMFNREADAAGLTGWIGARERGYSLTEMAQQFMQSQEYKKTYGALDDQTFVATLYYNVLDRAPDAAGLKAWTDALAAGRSRADVALAFSESAEHVKATDAWLNHVVDAKLSDFADTLIGGRGDNWLTGGRGSDYYVIEAKDQSLATIFGYETFDRVALSGFGFKSKADALSHAWQQGDDVYLASGGTTVVFDHTQLATLQGTAEDRWFLG